MEDSRINKLIVLSGILVIFHLVGLFFISKPETFEYFASLSWVNLFLTFILFILSYSPLSKKLVIFMLICFFTGMICEWIGVHTGLLFGQYNYGKNLGIKFFDVPISIGLNWIFLTISTANISSLFFKNNYSKSIFGATLMVGLDFLIEQIAPKLDFWFWKNNLVPLFNYVTWFIIGFFLQLIYFKFKIYRSNFFSIILFSILLIFFTVLNLTL
jgi:putative membrane protein